MNALRILVTTVGGLTSPDILKALRENDERPVQLVGVDSFENAVGRYFVDQFKVLPYSGDDEARFADAVFDLARKASIDLVVPCGNEDNLALARFRAGAPCPVMVANHATLLRAYDKGEVYRMLGASLAEHAPRYFIVTDHASFLAAARQLGYPKRKLVIKPRLGRGGRGVYTLAPDVGLDRLLVSKPSDEYTFEHFEGLLAEQGLKTDLIVMEHLGEPFHSVYSLCREGQQLAALDHVREWGGASQTFRGEIRRDRVLEQASANMVALFGLSFSINMELATSHDGRTVLFDLNPRIAASCAVDRDIGLNFPYLAVKIALGESVHVDLDTLDLPKRFIRHFSHVWAE